MTRSLLCLAASLAMLVGCSSSAPEPTTPNTPTRTLGLAFEPGPCVEGRNVVSASAFVGGPGGRKTYLKPTDGELLLHLVVNVQQPAPVIIRWLDVPDAPEQPLPGPPGNLELTFDSPVAGECPIRVEFEPSAEAAPEGLGSALTTIVLKDAPPPPSRHGIP